MQKIIPFLWFDQQAEEAANFYVSIFKDSRIVNVTRYGEAGHEVHGRPAGSVMTVEFELNGHAYTVLNGGPHFKFNEAISFHVGCDSQDEVDYFWEKLSAGGQEGSCGWLKDKYGVSWQVVPNALKNLLNDPAKAERTMSTLLQMKKLDIAKLEAAGDRSARH